MEFSALHQRLQGLPTYDLRKSVDLVDTMADAYRESPLEPVLRNISENMESFLDDLDFLIKADLVSEATKNEKLNSMARSLFNIRKAHGEFESLPERKQQVNFIEYQELTNAYYNYFDFYNAELRDFNISAESLDTPDLELFGYKYNSMGIVVRVPSEDIQSHYQEELVDSLSRFFKVFNMENQDAEHINRIYDSTINSILRGRLSLNSNETTVLNTDPFFFNKFTNIAKQIPDSEIKGLQEAINFLEKNPQRNLKELSDLNSFVTDLAKLVNQDQSQVLETLKTLVKGDENSYAAYLQLIDRSLMLDFSKVSPSQLAKTTLTVFKLYQSATNDWGVNLHAQAVSLGDFDDHGSSASRTLIQIFYHVKDYPKFFNDNIYQPQIPVEAKTLDLIHSKELDAEFKEFVGHGIGNVDKFFDNYSREFLLTNISKEEVQEAFSDLYRKDFSSLKLQGLKHKLYAKALLRNTTDKLKVAKMLMLISLAIEQKKDRMFYALRSMKKPLAQTLESPLLPYLQAVYTRKKAHPDYE